jgi:tetratricopeptide (TPR) repeat protein
MELVKGEPITAYCDRHTLSTRARLELFGDVCRAVQHAHQKGVIHRDLKPSNVMVTMHDGVPVPKVIDFGIAKATNARLTERTVFTEYQQFIGTPEYMSPEQAEMSGLDIDTRSDVYALGVLLYELLTGTTPFDARALREAGYVELQRIIREDEPDKPSTRLSTLGSLLPALARRRDTDGGSLARALRGDLDWIVMRCLEKDRTRRYEMASDLAADIERHLMDEPVLAGAPSAAYRVRKFVRRNRVLVTTGAAIAATLVVATIVSAAATVVAVRSAMEADASREESEAVTGFLSEMLASVKPDRLGREVLVTDVLDEASERVGRDFADQPLVEAELRRVMADSFVALGRYQEAEPHALRAEEIRRRELGSLHPDTLDAAGALGQVLTRTGQYGKSESVLTETLEGSREVLGNDHVATLRVMNDLGGLHVIAGRYDEARPFLTDVLDTRRRVLGPEDPSTLVSMHNLANLFLRTGALDEAMVLHEEALPIQRRVLGDDHRYTLSTMLSLASLYGWQGDLERAEQMLAETLPAHRRVLGEKHMQTLQVMGNLAVLYQMGEKYDLAEPLHEQILATRRETLGEMHHDTLQSRLGLADLYRHTGRYVEAEALVTEVLEGEHELEETSVIMLLATSELARLLVLREPESAREPERALVLMDQTCALAAPAPELLDALAFVRFQTGDVAGAVEAQRQAVELSPGDEKLQARFARYEAALAGQ